VGVVSEYGIALFPQHAALLRASAISPDVARQRNYQSVDIKARLESIDIAKAHRLVPGLLLPVYGPECRNGEASTWQYRPDHPRLDAKGKPVKYVTAQRGMVVDVPPAVRPHIGDPGRPLWITEGIRKVDSAVTAGIDCLGVLGVWNWRGGNTTGGRTALGAWEHVALNDRDVYLCFDSDVMVKASVRKALRRFVGFLEYRKAVVRLVMLPDAGAGKTGLDDYLAAGGTVDDLDADGRIIWPAELDDVAGASKPKQAPLPPPDPDGAVLLDDVAAFIGRFVAFPHEHALVASALWAAHTHGLAAFESTPRVGYLAPERECGKTRALEILGLLVPNPMHAVNATPAALFRSVESGPTIMYDEIDTVFGPRAKENEEIRGLLNAGHRRAGVAYRCVGEGTNQQVVAFPAYCAVAFAGIGDLPDTIMSRTVVVPMRRRAPHETVEPFRARLHESSGHALRVRLASWVASKADEMGGAWPDMPDGVTDRAADVWEPLLAVADAAGGHWPERARAACVAFVSAAAEGGAESLGVRLLADLFEIFHNATSGDVASAMSTEQILDRLHELDESPWKDLRGKPLDARGLANRLRRYGVRSKTVRVSSTVNGIPGESTPKGYTRSDLWDPWLRYLHDFRSPDDRSATNATSAAPQVRGSHMDASMDSGVDPPSATDEPMPEPIPDAVTSNVAAVAAVADPSQTDPPDATDAQTPRWEW
jgi:Protein of unknown function (DUF3631)/Domain of unknown function (DUF3854)